MYVCAHASYLYKTENSSLYINKTTIRIIMKRPTVLLRLSVAAESKGRSSGIFCIWRGSFVSVAALFWLGISTRSRVCVCMVYTPTWNARVYQGGRRDKNALRLSWLSVDAVPPNRTDALNFWRRHLRPAFPASHVCALLFIFYFAPRWWPATGHQRTAAEGVVLPVSRPPYLSSPVEVRFFF